MLAQPRRRLVPLSPLDNPRTPSIKSVPPQPESVASGSRSTSASSHRSTEKPLRASANDLLSTLAASITTDEPQADAVLKVMLPIVKRAMISKNEAVFQASLESLRKIENMFGNAALDKCLGSFVEALEKHPGGDARIIEVLGVLKSLCSSEASVILQRRFPRQVA